MPERYTGRLRKWNAERGFGFIVADDGGAELFVHISAFASNGAAPAVGDALSFEVQPDRDGKRRAVRVLQAAEKPANAVALRRHRMSRSPKHNGPGFFSKVLTVVLVTAVVWFAYQAYATRAAKYGSDSSVPSPALLPALSVPVPANFQCDGRTLCSQMTSCREATLFLQNCPATQMDGNGDGVPCEKQWCTN